LSDNNSSVLQNLTDRLLTIDPVYFAENYLTIEGKKFDLHSSGYKPFAEMYRSIGIKALEKSALPTVIVAARQVGKMLALDTELPTPNGFVKLIDLQEGDELFDECGNICKVLQLHPIDLQPKSYRITFDDRTTVDACADHQWITWDKSARRSSRRAENPRCFPEVRTTQQIYDTLLTKTSKTEVNHSIQCAKPINYSYKNLPIDPYVLGCWLGDGLTNGGYIECADAEILNEINKAGYSTILCFRTANISKSHKYRIGYLCEEKENGRQRYKQGKLKKELKENNLIGNKHIPDQYLIASYEQRLSLLQGLLDTDGSCTEKGLIEYCTVLPALAKQVEILIKSLGIKTRVNQNESWLYNKRCKDRYRLTFTTELPVFRLQRKSDRIRHINQCQKREQHYIVNVEPIDPVPMRCITVSSPSHQFLITRSFIPTHNTTLATALELYFMTCGHFGNGSNPPMRVIHAFPYLEYAAAFSKVKLSAMISGSKLVGDLNDTTKKQKPFVQSMLDTSSPTNDSLSFKQFLGGNHLWIDSIGMDGGRIRGRTADVFFADEVQMMPAQALGNATKILTTAKYGPVGNGVQVYFGTPLQRGSEYWQMWNQSTQQYFHLRCGKCKALFPLYCAGDDTWENTWLYHFTVRCPHCGFDQDKRDATENGKWVATKPVSDAKFIGFHINQLFVPDFTKEKILSEKPGQSPINTERMYQNEVLGEFYHGEAGIISPDQIRELCGDPERKFRASISQEEDVLTFLGIDFGAKSDLEQLSPDERRTSGGQSYSTAVVISSSGAHKLNIEFAIKFKRNDTEYTKDLIAQLMKKYSITLAVNDIGFSYHISGDLQNMYGGKLLSSQALPKVNEKAKFNDQVFPKTISFEKDFWIADIYEQMKKGLIRFPFGNYEQLAWLISHCTNMEIKPSISRTGDVRPIYVKSGNNDGFMALLNAYIAYKFYISEGFNIKNPMIMKEIGVEQKPAVLSMYLPNFGKRKITYK